MLLDSFEVSTAVSGVNSKFHPVHAQLPKQEHYRSNKGSLRTRFTNLPCRLYGLTSTNYIVDVKNKGEQTGKRGSAIAECLSA
jgi:hypothetical protein